MKFPSFKSKSSKEDEEDGEADNGSVTQAQASEQQELTPQPPEQQKPDKSGEEKKKGFFSKKPKAPKKTSDQQDLAPQPPEEKKAEKEPGKEKKGGFFSRKPKAPKQEKSRGEKADAKPASAKKGRGLFSRGPFGRGKKTDVPEDHPTELVTIPGTRVMVPTYEDIDKYQSIVYPVKEPYQFVNLHMENGELIYTDIEPQLTAREKAIFKKTGDAYDMLVNVSTVLTSAEDKTQFLDDTFREITKIYNMKLSDLEYQRILYYINRDYVGYGKIDTLISDRLIEDISCNGPNAPLYVYHRFFESIKTNVMFEEVELNNFILRLAQFSGRHISILQPIRDAALPDGSRINMTLGKEVTKKGSTFTIRKFRSDPISPVEIMILHTADSRIFAFLWVLIEYGRSLLISGGTAAGKSIPYQERVFVYKSGKPTLVSIGKLYDEIAKSKPASRVRGAHQYEVLDCDNMETAAFGPDLKVRTCPVKSIVRHPADKSVYKVRTRTGRVVKTTGDHSLFTIANGSAVAYPASQLSPGMYVAIPRTIPGPTENPAKSIDLLELLSKEDHGLYVENVVEQVRRASEKIGQRETAKLLGIQERMLRAALKKGTLAVRVNRFMRLVEKVGMKITPDGLRIRPKTLARHGLPSVLPVSKSLMRFMGYWTAEGKYDSGLILYQVDEETKKDMERAGGEAFGLPAHRHATDSMRFEFKYTVLMALFKHLFGPGEGAGAKTIPDLVLEQSDELLAEFLKGYFTGDGNAWRQVEASTKSHELSQRLLYALSRFGIVASVRPRVIKGRKYYNVSIYGQRNLQIFEQKIGFVNRKGRETLAKFASRKIEAHTNVDTIPGIADLLKEALMFKGGTERRQVWSDWHSYWAPKTAKRIGRQTLVSFLEETGAEGDVRDRLLTLAYSDIFWDEVVDVEVEAYDGKYVYDLEVPGAQNFVGGEGGMFLHNTTLLNAISMLIKPDHKIVSVEDTPEINLAHGNWIQAVTRVGFGESGGSVSGVSGISGVSGGGGKSAGDISLYDLLIAALRQRPDFIIVGEVRGEEAYTLFQAISVGHATMGTIHAASMPELLARAESQPMNVPRVLIANLDIVIFLAAVRKGDEKVRRIREMVEILGVNPATKELVTNVVFRWDPVKDEYEFNGRSFQIEKISKAYGIPMETLDREIENRINLLERMKKEGIINYRAVTEVIRSYYLDHNAVLRAEKLSAAIPTDTGGVAWGGKGGEKI